jgi:hypothetical protein
LLYIQGMNAAFFLLLAALAAPSAQATQGAAAPTGMGRPWDDPDSRTCGQNCLYEKANENILLQISYTNNKIEMLKEAQSRGEMAKIQDNLAYFCTPGEATGACFSRYKRLQILVLQKMRASLVNNSGSAEELNSDNRATSGGRAAPAAGGGVSPGVRYFEMKGKAGQPPKKPLIPYVPTFEDLQAMYRGLPARQGRAELQRWTQQVMQPPRPEDFVKFQRVPRDPRNPGAERIIVPEKGSNGQPVLDPQAYQRALAAYRARQADYDADRALMMSQANPLFPTPGVAPTMDDSVTGAESKTSFLQSRAMIIQAVSPRLTDGRAGVPATVSFPGAASGRAPAASPGVAPPPAGASGTASAATVAPSLTPRNTIAPTNDRVRDRRTAPDASDLFLTYDPVLIDYAIDSINP